MGLTKGWALFAEQVQFRVMGIHDLISWKVLSLTISEGLAFIRVHYHCRVLFKLNDSKHKEFCCCRCGNGQDLLKLTLRAIWSEVSLKAVVAVCIVVRGAGPCLQGRG